MSISVLHVTQSVREGVARCVANLVDDQLARGWEIAVASPTDGDLSEWVQSSGARHFPWQASRRPGPGVAGEVRRLAELVERLDPDLLHLHSSKAGLAGRLAIRGRRPTVFQPHAWSFFAARGPVRRAALAWERFAARWADVIVCVSEGERRDGEKAGIRATWRVVPNGVDLGVFSPASEQERADARGALGLADGPLALCVGRLSRQKGQDVLLAAWPEVARRVSVAQLVLVGDGPAEPKLRSHAGSGVHFAGRRADVDRWLAAADVVAAPSRWEGLSLGLLEAMARERSVVATETAGFEELLPPEALVPVGDSTRLADAIAKRLLDRELRTAEGRANRAQVEAKHDLRQATQGAADVYDELLSAQTERRR